MELYPRVTVGGGPRPSCHLSIEIGDKFIGKQSQKGVSALTVMEQDAFASF